MTHIKVRFPKLTDEEWKHVIRAERELYKAGIRFDIGTDVEDNSRVWELDWSLKGMSIEVKK